MQPTIGLADALQRGGVLPRVDGNDRYEVFRAAIDDLPVSGAFDREGLLDLLMARERSGGTAIGHGIAIPHPRYPLVLPGCGALVRVCFLVHPLEYRAPDGRQVDTLFLMICPTSQEHARLLAGLAGILQAADFRNLLGTRPSEVQLVSAIRAAEATFAENASLKILPTP